MQLHNTIHQLDAIIQLAGKATKADPHVILIDAIFISIDPAHKLRH